MELARRNPTAAEATDRPAVRAALRGGAIAEIHLALAEEEAAERAADRAYWAPLRQDLERLRLSRRRDA